MKNETEYKGILQEETKRIVEINPRFHRIASMLLDHFIMTFVITPPMMIVMILTSAGKLEEGNNSLSMIFFFIMFIYLNKDFFNAKSPAKRILGYQVVNRNNELPASELQCFVRNLTITIAWPLEVIVGLINPERRIGDFLANTKVVVSEKEKLDTILVDCKRKTLKLNFIGIVLLGIVYFYGLSLLLPDMN